MKNEVARIAELPGIEDLAPTQKGIMVPKEEVSSIVEIIMKEDKRR